MDHIAKSGTTTSAAAHREYEEFEPPFEWTKEDGVDNLLVFLPGFQKDRLKIQITSTEKLRVSGERPIDHNKWRHFVKEFPLEHDRDTNKISAKFEGGILYIKVPKAVPVSPPPPRTSTHANNKAKAKPTSEKKTTALPPGTTADHDQVAQLLPTPQQQQQQKQAPPPKPAVAPADKQQADVKTNNIDHDQLPMKPINAEKKDYIKEAQVVSNDEKASEKTTLDKAEKITPPTTQAQKGPASSPNHGLDRATNKAVDEKRNTSTADVADRSINDKSADSEGGQKKGLVKNPRILVNVAVAALVLVVLALYAKNAIRFFKQSSSSASDEL